MSLTAQSIRFSLTAMLLAVALLAVIIAAFVRGNQLLGVGVGVIYAIVALMMALITIRALLQRPLPKIRIAVHALFAIPVAFAFAFPASINPDVQIFVDKLALERTARSELAVVFNSDSAFASVYVSVVQFKCVNVNISGSVQTKRDLLRLQSRILENCQSIDRCCVNWRIYVADDSIFYAARDDETLQPDL
jgi:hypothetical protein